MRLRNKIRQALTKFNNRWYTDNEAKITQPSPTISNAQLQLGHIHIVPTKENSKIGGANWLADFKGNNASEHGEDGIIAKIFQLMPPKNKWVCEFGAHDPQIISNTWQLINKENWSALLIEADAGYFKKLQDYYKKSDNVHCVQTIVSYEGEQKLDAILKNTPVPLDLDFMVIDIDGNDYHVWEAIDTYRANVVMIEFNAAIPIDIDYVQPRNLSTNKGTSLKAMVNLANKKGYKLIACTAWNAFFVKEEYYSIFFKTEPALADFYVYPVRHPIWMRGFQLYDGTIIIAHWKSMLWHKIDLDKSDYQTLPVSYRYFNHTLATQAAMHEENLEHLKKIYAMPGNILSKYAANTYSYYGEDGIVEKLCESLSVNPLLYVDVGAGDGLSFTRSRILFEKHGWQGLLLENDASLQKTLKQHYAKYQKMKINEGVYGLTGETSLDAILKKNNVPFDFNILFLNSFGMEYYLWESLADFSPKIVAVQFNPTIPNDVHYVQSKDFSIHQGCSLKALVDLAHYKNYELVAVTLGTAFFVHRKFHYRLFELFGIQHTDIDEIFVPFKMQLFQLYDGTIGLNGLKRLMWHGIQINEEKLQVVPSELRQFHQYADAKSKNIFYRV